MVWGGGKGRRLFPLPRLPLGSLRSPIFFPFSPNAEPSLKLLPTVSSFNPGHFFLFCCSHQLNFTTDSPGDACYAAEKLMVRTNLHYHKKKKKHENGARHCIFNLVHLIAHQTLEPFFIKTFCCRRLLSYHFVMVLLSSHYLSRPVCLC